MQDIIKQQSRLLPFIICGLAALFYVYDYFIQVAPSVITQQLMQDFSIGAARLGILSACFYYSYTIMQIPAGLLTDRFGSRKLLSFAVLVSAFGVTLFGLTDSLWVAGFARFLIGLGSSFAFISALFLVSRWFPHKYFAVFAGFVQLGGCLGSIFGLAPLAAVINHVGWREAMIVTGIITFGLAAIYWLVIRDGGINQQTDLGKEVENEWQRLKRIVVNRQVWWIAACGLLSWVPVATVGALWGVPYLMKVYHWDNTSAGKLCSLFWIGLGIGSPFIGWLSDKIASRCWPLIFCFSAGLLGGILLILAPWVNVVIVGLALVLLGFSASAQSLTFGVVKDILPANIFATASGFNNMAAIIGGAISQPLFGLLLSLLWNGTRINGIPSYAAHDFQIALILLPCAAFLGVLVSRFKLKETHCRPLV